jgi:hypothetical protein
MSSNKIERAKKANKMSVSFRQKLRAWLFEDHTESDTVISIDEEDSRIELESSIHFTVTNASGGRIVQVRHYDRKTDRNVHSLHIITPDEDLSEALAHILVLETVGR